MKNLLKLGVLVALTIGTTAQAQCFATPEEHAQIALVSVGKDFNHES